MGREARGRRSAAAHVFSGLFREAAVFVRSTGFSRNLRAGFRLKAVLRTKTFLREAAVKSVTTAGGAALSVNLVGGPGGDRLLAREPVTPADLLLARDETWLDGLRDGVLGADLANMTLEVIAASEGGDER